jgi:predicted RNA-binding protein with RPS1 domain
VDVKYLGNNDKGQMRLSRRAVMLRDAPPGSSSLPEGSDTAVVDAAPTAVAEIGTVYEDCEIKSVHPYGVFVEVLPGVEGLVHASELDVKKVTKPASSFQVGQLLTVKYLSNNEQGKMVLSRKVLIEDGTLKETEQPVSPPPELGMIYRNCRIVSLQKFGVFVEVTPGHEGLVHVSELDIKKVANVENTFSIGQTIDVKYLEDNEKVQINLIIFLSSFS